MTDKTLLSDSLASVGGGTALAVVYLGAVIPGFLVVLTLTVAVVAVLIAPFVVLGLATGITVAPPYALWRIVTGVRSRRRREKTAVQAVQPVPSPHVC
jgi:hypothetical protein